jgi:hypothetical protein
MAQQTSDPMVFISSDGDPAEAQDASADTNTSAMASCAVASSASAGLIRPSVDSGAEMSRETALESVEKSGSDILSNASASTYAGVPTECPTCKCFLIDPLQLPCEHVACRSCVKQLTGGVILSTQRGIAAICPVQNCGKGYTADSILKTSVTPYTAAILPSQALLSHLYPGVVPITKAEALNPDAVVGDCVHPLSVQTAAGTLVLDMLPCYALAEDAVRDQIRREAELPACDFCTATVAKGSNIPFATTYCAMCGFLCDQCSLRHKAVRSTAMHPTSSATSPDAKMSSEFCSTHPGKTTRGVCRQCEDVAVCEDCLSFGSHRGHRAQLLGEYQEELAKVVASKLPSLESRISQCSAGIDLVDTTYAIIQGEMLDKVTAIDHLHDTLKATLEARMNALKDSVTNIFESRKRMLQVQRAGLVESVQGLSHMRDAVAKHEGMRLAARSVEARRLLSTVMNSHASPVEPWVGGAIDVDLEPLTRILMAITTAGSVAECTTLQPPTGLAVSVAFNMIGEPPSLCLVGTLKWEPHRPTKSTKDLLKSAGKPASTRVEYQLRRSWGAETTVLDINSFAFTLMQAHAWQRVEATASVRVRMTEVETPYNEWTDWSSPLQFQFPAAIMEIILVGAGGAATADEGCYGGAGGIVRAKFYVGASEMRNLTVVVGAGGQFNSSEPHARAFHGMRIASKPFASGGGATYVALANGTVILGAGGGGGAACGSSTGSTCGGGGGGGTADKKVGMPGNNSQRWGKHGGGDAGAGCTCVAAASMMGDKPGSTAGSVSVVNSNGAPGANTPTEVPVAGAYYGSGHHLHSHGGGRGGAASVHGCIGGSFEVINAADRTPVSFPDVAVPPSGKGGAERGKAGDAGFALIIMPDGTTMTFKVPGSHSLVF